MRYKLQLFVVAFFTFFYVSTADQACHAQQERVTRKANEYRLFAHGMACYFVERLSALPALEVGRRGSAARLRLQTKWLYVVFQSGEAGTGVVKVITVVVGE